MAQGDPVNKSTPKDIKQLWKDRYGTDGSFHLSGHWSGGQTTWSWDALEAKKRGLDGDSVNSIKMFQALLAARFTGESAKPTKFNPDILTIEYVALQKNLALPGALATFKDSFAPRFNKENVYGRMDPVATYQGTTRTINFAWTIDILGDPAQTEAMLAAVGDLAKFMYPVYQSTSMNELGTGTMVSPPLLRFRLSNASGGNLNLMRNTAPGALSEGLLAVVDSFTYLTYTAGIRGGELNVTRLIDKAGQLALIPTHVEVNFGLTILHEDGKVGWTWNKDDAGAETISFAQGTDYPYGYGTTFKDATMAAAASPADPAGVTVESGASTGDQTTLDNEGDAGKIIVPVPVVA